MTIDLTCPYCNFAKKVPEEKIPAGARWATCPRCNQRFEISTSNRDGRFTTSKAVAPTQHQDAGGASEEEPLRGGAPWEDRSGLGLWQAIYQTIKGVLFSPDTYFRMLTFRGGLREPLAFGLLTGSLGCMLSVFWQILMFSGGLLSIGDAITGQLTFGLVFIVAVVFIPIAVILGMFVSSAIWHLFLLLLRGADNGFEATFRVICYSQAAQVWGLIPFVGSWISFIWQLIVQIVGLREVHETSYLKVIFAFLIPVTIVVFFVITAIILLVIFIGRHQFDQLWS